jgi:hypothetical protein
MYKIFAPLQEVGVCILCVGWRDGEGKDKSFRETIKQTLLNDQLQIELPMGSKEWMAFSAKMM